MADVTVKRLEEFEALYGGGMRRVRAGLGVTSFGMQVIELPPNFEMYPEHNHLHDEQEEVYTVLEGSATLRVGDEDHQLEPGVFARVAPTERRKFVTGAEGARILAIGGVPGKAYVPPEFSEEGAPVPHMDKAKSQLEASGA
jgi:quercetin dioxygenase-like cupin family protein